MPSAAIALTSAHSNALRTSPVASPIASLTTSRLPTRPATTEVAHFSLPRSCALLGSWRQSRSAWTRVQKAVIVPAVVQVQHDDLRAGHSRDLPHVALVQHEISAGSVSGQARTSATS